MVASSVRATHLVTRFLTVVMLAGFLIGAITPNADGAPSRKRFAPPTSVTYTGRTTCTEVEPDVCLVTSTFVVRGGRYLNLGHADRSATYRDNVWRGGARDIRS